MSEVTPQSIDVGQGAAARRIAVRATPPARAGAPGIFWLSGYKSDMSSTKATAVAAWAAEQGLGATRFDYSGHGISSGRFEDGTIGQWLEEAEAVFRRVSAGPQIVIGSSMGGHIALLLLRRLLQQSPAEAARVLGVVLIAPAWDMTEELMWEQFGPAERRDLVEKGVYLRPSEYGEPYAITRALIEDGRRHLIGPAPFDPGRPVHIIQGLLDRDVPAAHVRQLVDLIPGNRVTLEEVPDGEHRLSRPEDLARLFNAVERLTAPAA